VGEADREPVEEHASEKPAPSSIEANAGEGWKRRLPLAIVTLAPTVYLVTRIYLRTGDIGLALGAGLICPFCVYGVIGTWLDESSALTRTSWARWSNNHADKRPLLFAITGALVFVVFLSIMWLIGPLVVRY
jgi:hypothetical protein